VELKVSVEGAAREEVEGVVDAAIKSFDDYFQSIQAPEQRTGLTGYERAAIKTFVAYMLGIRPSGSSPKG